MKKTKIYLMSLAIITIALFNGCSKDGETGPAGPAGANGTNGNANVIMAMFGTQNLTSSASSFSVVLPAPITSNMIDSSLVLVYHQSTGCGAFWYLSNGLGCGGTYSTRVFTTGTNLTMQIHNPDGTAYNGFPVVMTKVKVIVAPSSGYSGSRASVDFSNYEETLKFFNLKDN
jgi:hypothetical protein